MELYAEATIATSSYDQLFASSTAQTLYSPRIHGGTLATAETGKRVEIINDEVRIYDALNQQVATLSGSSIAGISSSIDTLAGRFEVLLLTDKGIGADYTALADAVDAAVASATGDLYISTRKATPIGATEILLVPAVTGRVRAYERLQIVPRSGAPSSPQKGDLYVESSDGKLYIYNGSGWVVAGTQT